jgi:RNA recognition motif-containing protein
MGEPRVFHLRNKVQGSVLFMGSDEAKLFVAGLPDSISEDVLKQLFEATGGKVISVSLPKDRATGRPRGFGFVTLSTPAEAQAARDALDGSFQQGRSISVRPFQAEPPKRDGAGPMSGPRSSGGGPRGGGPQNAPDRTLYVGNLPYDSTQQEVEELVTGVAGAGAVVRVHLPTDADGRKRGFGFVTLSSAELCKTAMENLKTAEVRGRRLVVNLAQPKGERPPRDGGGGFERSFGGPPMGGGGGFGGGAPPPQRRTFDDRRRKKHGDGEGGGEGGRGGGRRNRHDRDDRFDKDDWSYDDRDE